MTKHHLQRVYIVADTHFGHSGMLSFKRNNGEPVRDFKNIEDMNNFMVQKWNEVVTDADLVLHLGDVALHPCAF